MRIGELAKSAQTRVDTIRFYERVGLLPKAARTASNYRSYARIHAERLAFIRRCRGLDMSLDEIRELLTFCDEPHRKCGAVNELVDRHIIDVESRIAQLQKLARELRRLSTVCGSPVKAKDCRVLQALRAS
ncbi:MAG: Cd(II)/Pb(II)-responsive transcriptional regulator [Burkholderiales bacterium]|jgi:Cd(II)/Pb(II)-responsive transcriptional regulator